MGAGCAVCKRDGINDPLRSRDIAQSWKSNQRAGRKSVLFDNPTDFFKPAGPLRRFNTSAKETMTASLKDPPDDPLRKKSEERPSEAESWVAVPRRDNSSETLGCNTNVAGVGVLLEFKPKASVAIVEQKEAQKKSVPAENVQIGEAGPAKTQPIKRGLTPRFDQNETASFGDKSRKDPEEYRKQVSGSSDSQGKEPVHHVLHSKVSQFSAGTIHDSVVVTKCAAQHNDPAQGKAGEDSLTIQRGSSMAQAAAKKASDTSCGNEAGEAVIPGIVSSEGLIEEGAQEETKKEEAKKGEPASAPASTVVSTVPKRLVTSKKVLCRRIVKSVDQGKMLQIYKQKVCRNVLKETHSIKLVERKETNTNTKGTRVRQNSRVATGDGFFNSSVISPINDLGGACNSSLAAAWGTSYPLIPLLEISAIDHSTDVLKSNGTPKVPSSNSTFHQIHS